MSKNSITIGYNGAQLGIDTSQDINQKNLSLYQGGTPEPIAFNFWGSPVYQAEDGTLLCPGFVGQTFATNLWDYVVLPGGGGGLIPDKSPGIVTVKCEKERSTDVKKSAGQDGARLTSSGMKPANIELQFLIWTPDQLRVLQNIWQTYMPLANKSQPSASHSSPQSPKPIDVVHPLLQFHGVKSILIVGGSGPDVGPVPKSRVFTMRCVEFFPIQASKTQIATAQASVANVNTPRVLVPGGNFLFPNSWVIPN